MAQLELILPQIAAYGLQYRTDHLRKYDPDRLIADWWEALQFFFGRAFYQGRRDNISARVHTAALEILSPLFSHANKTEQYNESRREDWASIESGLRKKIGRGFVGKGGDVRMTISTLNFIGQLPDLNLVKYSVGLIKEGRSLNHYLELQSGVNIRGEGIFQVGDKIASFYLRDVVSLYGLDEYVTAESAVVLQPIDVHVKKVCGLLGIAEKGDSNSKIKNRIVSVCRQQSISPILFNQGAWFVSSNHPDRLHCMLS
jgi:hypothetical protein